MAHGADKSPRRGSCHSAALPRVTGILLNFQPMAGYYEKNRKKEFRSENFPNYAYDSAYYILKVSTQMDQLFSRYRIYKRWTILRAFVKK